MTTMMTRSAWDLLDLANEVMAAGIVVCLVYRLGYRRGMAVCTQTYRRSMAEIIAEPRIARAAR